MTFISQNIKSSSSNIGNSDLTISSAGTRKLILGGALGSDRFDIRDSSDSYSQFVARGDGKVYIPGYGGNLNNTKIGYIGKTTDTISQSVLIGYDQGVGGSGLAGSNGVAIGFRALSWGNTGSSNFVSIGANAIGNNSGYTGSVAVGYRALGGGTYNVSIGFEAADDATGVANTVLGYRAWYNSGGGSGNIIIRGGGAVANMGLTSGSKNTLLGSLTGLGNPSNHVIIADGDGNYALMKDASDFVGVGYTVANTLGAKLDVKAHGALSTDLAFRVRNSADTADLLSVQGDGVFNYNASFHFRRTSGGVLPNASYSTYIGGDTAAQTMASGSVGITARFGYVTGNNSILIGGGGSRIALTGSNSTVLGVPVSNTSFGLSNAFAWMSVRPGSSPNFLVTADGHIMTNGNNINLTSTFVGSLTGTNVYVGINGTSPSANSADSFQMYSADIVAGNAAPHFRTEAGDTIKLYKYVAASFGNVINTGDGNTDDVITEIVNALTAHGLISTT